MVLELLTISLSPKSRPSLAIELTQIPLFTDFVKIGLPLFLGVKFIFLLEIKQ